MTQTALPTIMHMRSARPEISDLWRQMLLEGLTLFAAKFANERGEKMTYTVICGEERWESTIYPEGMVPEEDEE